MEQPHEDAKKLILSYSELIFIGENSARIGEFYIENENSFEETTRITWLCLFKPLMDYFILRTFEICFEKGGDLITLKNFYDAGLMNSELSRRYEEFKNKYEKNMRLVRQIIGHSKHIELSKKHQKTIKYYFDAFDEAGPIILEICNGQGIVSSMSIRKRHSAAKKSILSILSKHTPNV